ncbi:uncharacterized protein [Venturia canescens]|uniref:uncharacterized protein n=1 Tax=Venturia canescens TaxID=32260 RepID=UPI001C9C2B1A|nr:uncharacterized protein LOC122418281 [Venturia canescens]
MNPPSLTASPCQIVYFHILSANDNDITKIGAKLNDEMFDCWIKPVHSSAMMKGFEEFEWRNSKLFFRNEELSAVNLKTGLKMFLEFLKSSPKPIILISHSAYAGTELLCHAIVKSGLKRVFDGLIVGCIDSMEIFNKPPFDRTRTEQLALDVLYQDLLGLHYTQKFYDVPYYLTVLEELITSLIPTDYLIRNSVPYEEFMTSEDETDGDEDDGMGRDEGDSSEDETGGNGNRNGDIRYCASFSYRFIPIDQYENRNGL